MRLKLVADARKTARGLPHAAPERQAIQVTEAPCGWVSASLRSSPPGHCFSQISTVAMLVGGGS